MYPYILINGRYVHASELSRDLLYLQAKIMLLYVKMNEESYSDKEKQLIENLACTVEHYKKSVRF